MSTSELNLGAQYKKMQIDFLTWAAAWVRNEIELEPIPCDLPEVVNLLQALGFRIRTINDKQTHTMSPLRGGDSGSKLIISCTHSGQTCIMEQPTISTNCSCTKPPKNETNDAVWEVTATTPQATQGLVETGCDLIPQMTKEHSSIVKHVINFLLRMIREKNNFGSQSEINTTPIRLSGRRSEPCGNAALYLNRTPIKQNLLAHSNGGSPARYRSLDTLTAKNADLELPEPGTLMPKISAERKEHTYTISSPNIKLAVSDTSSGSTSTIEEPTITSKAVNIIRNASASLIKALNLIEMQSKKKSSLSPTAFEEKILTASKNIKRLICTSKPPPSTSTLSSGSSPILPTKSTGITIPKPRIRLRSDSYSLDVAKTVKPRVRKISDEKPSIPRPDGVFKKVDKYSHIKSTIPRVTEATKK